MGHHLDTEAARLDAIISPGPRLAVLGSTSFWGADSRDMCQAIAVELASIAPLVVLTGGMDGVGITFGRSFATARRAAGLSENLFHLLPRGMEPCNCGVTLGAGSDFYERREVLGRAGQAYLVIEGGPGTEHEVTVASCRGIPVIPLGRSGGHAGILMSRLKCPPWALATDWAVLADAARQHADVVAAVRRLVHAAFGASTDRLLQGRQQLDMTRD